MRLWSWIKSFWVSSPVENAVEFPYLLIKFDYKTNMVYVQVDWPKTIDKKILINDFSDVIATVESSLLHEVIRGTIMSLCEHRQDHQLGVSILEELNLKLSQGKMLGQDQLSMYPNEVFGRRGNDES